MPTSVSRTKVSAPKLEGIVPRRRLFALIDVLRSQGRRLIWLAGAPGSGKTTLASSYVDTLDMRVLWLRADQADVDPATLIAHIVAAVQGAGLGDEPRLPLITREHLADVGTYARLFFRALFEALATPHVIVLDDAHAVTGHPVCAQLIAVLVEELPDAWCMLVASRENAPDTLARSIVNGAVGELPAAALAFSVDEVRDLLLARKGQADEAQALHECTGGWAAALALLAGPGAGAFQGTAAGEARRHIEAYLNAEVFRGLRDEEQRGFLALAWLPTLRREWMAALEVPAAAQKRLDSMARDSILVQKYGPGGAETEYRFHALFRDFLRAKARATYTGKQLLAKQRAAVELLQEVGMPEAALALTVEMRAWSEACERIVSLAPAAMAAARQHTVIAWAEAIPDAWRSAWLRYWLGQAQMSTDTTQGRENVGKAFEVFKREANVSACLRALSVLISTYCFEGSNLDSLTRWLGELHLLNADYEALDDDHTKAAAAAGAFSLLILRDPEHSDFALWESRVHAMLEFDIDPNLKIRGATLLARHYWNVGRHPSIWPLAERVVRELGKPGMTPYGRLLMSWLLIYDAWSKADPARGRHTATQALELAERSAIHMLDAFLRLHAASFALAHGDEDAELLLDRATALHNPARRMDGWHLFVCRTWQALQAKSHARAIEYATIALDAAEPVGTSARCTALVGLCHALLGAGDSQELAPRLQRLTTLALAADNRWGSFHAGLIAARLAQREGRVNLCLDHLAEAFTVGRQNHLYCFLFAESETLASLCGEALRAGIEVDYSRELILRQRLPPPEQPELREVWPWPLRINTLGRFALLIDGRPLAERGKAQKKTLELLKALIAMGGREVNASELADVLWPEAEGDAARSAFDMSLHRLRKLLGCENAVLIREGKASLNPDVCWVDVWAFERALCEPVADGEGSGAERAAAAGSTGHERAISLYQGPFLSSESARPWMLPARERLRQRFLRAVLTSGQRSEARGDWESAAAIYERGLEHDSVAEDLYRRLMLCHLERDDFCAMAGTYRRCVEMLDAVLGTRPSASTEAILRRHPVVSEAAERDPSLRKLAIAAK